MDKSLVWAYIEAQPTFLYEYIINAHTARYNRPLAVKYAEDLAQEMRETGHMPCFIIEYTKDRLRKEHKENLTNELSPAQMQLPIDYPKE